LPPRPRAGFIANVAFQMPIVILGLLRLASRRAKDSEHFWLIFDTPLPKKQYR